MKTEFFFYDKGGAWRDVLAAFVEDIGSVSSTHQVTHNHSELSF